MTIYVLQSDQVGDNNAALGVANTLCAEAGMLGHSIKAINVLKDDLSNLDLEDAAFIIGSGRPCASFMRDYQGVAHTVFLTHQKFDGLFDVAANVTYLCMPQTALDEKDVVGLNSVTKLMLLNGMPHNVNESSIMAARLSDEDADMVILGGDAPDEHGKQLYYSPDEAYQFGLWLAGETIKRDRPLLVTNGPRTGKFDPSTGMEVGAHKEGAPLDRVTESFMEGLRDGGMDMNRVDLRDFRFGQPSAYLGGLGMALNGGRVYVPGESMSMVTEVTDVLDGGQVIVYDVGSMNPNHTRHVQSVFNVGKCAWRGMSGVIMPPEDGFRKGVGCSPDAFNIVRALIVAHSDPAPAYHP